LFRQIDLNAELGHEKGSWKGGMTGTSIEINEHDTYKSAIKKFCNKEQSDKSGKYKLTYIGEALFNGI
jgi:hypothetical protein